MTNPLKELILVEDGVYVFNPEGTGGVVDINPMDAGRAAAGLRLAGKVNKAEISLVSESNPGIKYVWNVKTQKLDEWVKRDVLSGNGWQPTGREHSGYLQTSDDGRTFVHTPAAHFAVMFAMKDRQYRCPVTAKNQNAVELQIELSGMSDVERQMHQANQSTRIAVRV